MATFAEIIEYKVGENIDGISFLPTLLHKDQQKHEYLNWEYQLSGWFQNLPNGGFRQSVRIGDWKAVRYNLNSMIELYDLNNDHGEEENLAHLNPSIVERANSIFETSRSDADGFPYGGVIQDYKSMDRFEK